MPSVEDARRVGGVFFSKDSDGWGREEEKRRAGKGSDPVDTQGEFSSTPSFLLSFFSIFFSFFPVGRGSSHGQAPLFSNCRKRANLRELLLLLVFSLSKRERERLCERRSGCGWLGTAGPFYSLP